MTQIYLNLEEEFLKELFIDKTGEAMKKLTEKVLNSILNAEAGEKIGAEPYERNENRITQRNGFRSRAFTTRVGTLELQIPKLRNGHFSTTLLRSFQRSEQALTLSLMEMVIQGVSTRKVTEITETLCGTSFSKSTVSALCSQLDPAIDEFRNRPLEKHYPFISADAIYMRVRKNKRIISIGLLIAIGVNQEGKREILGFTTNKGESTSAWADFFKELKNRGLAKVDIVTSDNHGGIREASPRTSWIKHQKRLEASCTEN